MLTILQLPFGAGAGDVAVGEVLVDGPEGGPDERRDGAVEADALANYNGLQIGHIEIL